MKKYFLFLSYFFRLVLIALCLYFGKLGLNIYTFLAIFLFISVAGRCCFIAAVYEKIQFLLGKERYYLKDLLRLNPEPVMVFSNEGKIVYQNLAAQKNLPNIKSFGDVFTEDIESIIDNELTVDAVCPMDDKSIWYEFFAKGVKKNHSVFMYGFNIDSLMQAQNKLETTLTIDSLTGLGNRKKINQDVAKLSCGVRALACMDIMKFGELNAFYGHNLGDILLISFSRFLKKFSKAHESIKGIYRLNGNTFAVLFQFRSDADDTLKQITEKHLKELIQTLRLEVFGNEMVDINIDIRIGASVASGLEDLKQATRRLILESETALQEAKKENKEIVFYGQLEGIEEEYSRNITISKKLRNILIHKKSKAQIVPYFQPVFCMKSRCTQRYEALARIVDGNEVKTPGEFLEAAKKLRLLPKITEQIYRKSLETFSKTEYGFSVNITTQDLKCKPLLDLFDELCQQYEFEPKKILFEVVEDEDIYEHKDAIGHLQSKGFKVAIDDFGSGYSNFKKLQDIKAEIIKIDGSLIRNITENKEDFEVVRAIVSYGKSIGARMIAEFVSSREIYEKLLELDIDYMQGFYIGKPEPKLQEEFLDFL